MLIILRMLKALTQAIVDAKIQRVERELTMRGIAYRPLPRLTRD